MLYIFNNNTQNTEVNEALDFSKTGIQTGCVAVRTSNGSANIDRCGYYMVHFNGSSAATTADASGNVSAQLYINGIAYNGAITSAQSAGPEDVVSISFTALVKIEPNCNCNTSNIPAYVEIRNVGVAATYTNIALTITKVA